MGNGKILINIFIYGTWITLIVWANIEGELEKIKMLSPVLIMFTLVAVPKSYLYFIRWLCYAQGETDKF